MQLILWGLAALVGAFIGSYLGSYLKKKGENLATHEDIDKLVEQVRAVTTATKEIEAKTSIGVWDRQKRWELKREVLFETTKCIAAVKDALARLSAVYETEETSQREGGPERRETRAKAGAESSEAANRLEQAILLVDLACGPELKKGLLDFALFARRLSLQILDGRPETFMTSLNELVAKLDALRVEMRREIGVEKPGGSP